MLKQALFTLAIIAVFATSVSAAPPGTGTGTGNGGGTLHGGGGNSSTLPPPNTVSGIKLANSSSGFILGSFGVFTGTRGSTDGYQSTSLDSVRSR